MCKYCIRSETLITFGILEEMRRYKQMYKTNEVFFHTLLQLYRLVSCCFLTLSLLGYLKTRIRWGGVQFDPPPLNPMFDVQIWQIIHHWKALVLYFWNLQKNLQICKNWIFFCKIQLYSENVCKKKIVQKMINYTFLKSPWPCHFKYAKSFAKF